MKGRKGGIKKTYIPEDDRVSEPVDAVEDCAKLIPFYPSPNLYTRDKNAKYNLCTKETPSQRRGYLYPNI